MSSGPDGSPLSHARAAALAELRAAPVAVPWTREAGLLSAALVAIGLLAGTAAVVGAIARPGDVAAHGVAIAALLALAFVAGVATIAPPAAGAGPWRALALAAAPLVMVGLVLGRGVGLPSSTPPWVCSVSHFAVGLVPLWLVLRGLRQAAWSWGRALGASVGVGTAGPLLGELACQRGALHVLAHHVGAWVAIVAVGLWISRRQKPRTFAP